MYADEGVQVKKDLEAVGFKGIKIFESAQNNTRNKTGEIYMAGKFGQLQNKMKMLGIEDEDQHKKVF